MRARVEKVDVLGWNKSKAASIPDQNNEESIDGIQDNKKNR